MRTGCMEKGVASEGESSASEPDESAQLQVPLSKPLLEMPACIFQPNYRRTAMDDRQRYGYDGGRNERDDFRNENWRDRERYQDREFSMRNRYGSQDDWNTDRGRDEYISSDRQGFRNEGNYGYGQGPRENYRTAGDR